MTIESDVARHYSHRGKLDAILAGLRTLGRDEDRIEPDDLNGVDEFHMAGREATAGIAAKLPLHPGVTLLDVGSGIGGPARFFAMTTGAFVTGIDLTPDHVETASELNRRIGLADRVTFTLGSALDLPFVPESFDVATMLHVAMNIADKERLFAEVHRVLRPRGTFAVYDPMRLADGALEFPLPWAGDERTSFLATPAAYRAALTKAGFSVEPEIDWSRRAIDFFERARARMTESGPPPLGPHISMGDDAPVKIGNLMAALKKGFVSPIEMISRRAD